MRYVRAAFVGAIMCSLSLVVEARPAVESRPFVPCTYEVHIIYYGMGGGEDGYPILDLETTSIVRNYNYYLDDGSMPEVVLPHQQSPYANSRKRLRFQAITAEVSPYPAPKIDPLRHDANLPVMIVETIVTHVPPDRWKYIYDLGSIDRNNLSLKNKPE